MLVCLSALFIISAFFFTATRHHKGSMNIWLLLMFVLSAFNYDNPDYIPYLTTYNQGLEEHEWLYNLLALYAQRLGITFIGFRLILILCCFLLIRHTVNKYCIRPDVFCILYFLFPFFLDVVQLRNFIAMSILIYGFPYLLQKNIAGRIYFLILLLIAGGFQSVAYIYLPFAFWDILVKNIAIKNLLIIISICFIILYYSVQFYLDDILSLLVDNYGDLDSRIDNIGNAGISEYGYLMYWMFHFASIIFTYCFMKNNSSSSKCYQFLKMLFYAELFTTITLPLVVFDSTFERFSRNLIPLLFVGLCMQDKSERTANPYRNSVINCLFGVYIICMCYMDIINGYYDTIIIPIFTRNLLL